MLLGRDAEHARLEDLIDRARSGASAALVIRGEPGIGKSALLEDAVAGAEGVTLLRARLSSDEATWRARSGSASSSAMRSSLEVDCRA